MSSKYKQVIPIDEINNLSKDDIVEQYRLLFRDVVIRSKEKKRLVNKLGIKTKALWLAAGIIADNRLIPNKTQEDVYEILKIMGLNEYNKSIE